MEKVDAKIFVISLISVMVGSSAKLNSITSGVLRGRIFGGTSIIYRKTSSHSLQLLLVPNALTLSE